MPELPEVETIKRALTEKLVGRAIVHVSCRRRDLRLVVPKNFAADVVGKKILQVRRRAKYLLWDLADGFSIVMHLGMSGRLYFCDSRRPLEKHDHVLIDMSDGSQVRFNDPRRFGLVTVLATQNLNAHPLFKNLGVEPLAFAFNDNLLFQLCRASAMAIKSILMDGTKIVGVGNIYANEALFLAQIRPTRRSNKISHQEAMQLCEAVKTVLKKSIESGGTTFRDYVQPDETPGLHQLHLYVYDRAGEPCRLCGSVIKRFVQTGRSSFYCSRCQV